MTDIVPTVGTVVIDCEDVDRLGQSLAFQQVPQKKTVKNRVHLDMRHPDPEAFVARVEELGGRRVEDHEIMGFHWSVLADPEGNDFCVAEAE